MTDIVDLPYRLRGLGYKTCDEAADEIERLRDEKTELLKKRNADDMQRMIDYWGKRAEKAEAEIERLRNMALRQP